MLTDDLKKKKQDSILEESVAQNSVAMEILSLSTHKAITFDPQQQHQPEQLESQQNMQEPSKPVLLSANTSYPDILIAGNGAYTADAFMKCFVAKVTAEVTELLKPLLDAKNIKQTHVAQRKKKPEVNMLLFCDMQMFCLFARNF